MISPEPCYFLLEMLDARLLLVDYHEQISHHLQRLFPAQLLQVILTHANDFAGITPIFPSLFPLPLFIPIPLSATF